MSFGTLFVVATPLGNLEDITFRAVRVLREVDVIACEDTRRTVKLLNRYEIRTPMAVFHDYNKARAGAGLLRRLREGMNVALVSDAGTPAISDPGYELVRDAVAAGIHVEVIPGPSALISALVVSGLPTDHFAFEGFLPNRPVPCRPPPWPRWTSWKAPKGRVSAMTCSAIVNCLPGDCVTPGSIC